MTEGCEELQPIASASVNVAATRAHEGESNAMHAGYASRVPPMNPSNSRTIAACVRLLTCASLHRQQRDNGDNASGTSLGTNVPRTMKKS